MEDFGLVHFVFSGNRGGISRFRAKLTINAILLEQKPTISLKLLF